ncbi:cupin domain-containing protein [Celerinatantimonas sp. YJH-8]|uniref:cupin domain-containing protein n=1 Tax=Celerinatantimonas sp. YJH-8 TaxID=3228714 RepID=UPI0038C7960E
MQIDLSKIDHWQPSQFEGIFFSVIHRQDIAQAVYVVKMAKACALPAHSHPGWEKIEVLQGTLAINRKQLQAGQKLKIPQDKVHTIAALEDSVYVAHAEKEGTTMA